MTRSSAREIAVQLVFSLSFGNESAQELLDSQLTQERFEELAAEMQKRITNGEAGSYDAALQIIMEYVEVE